MADNKSKRCPYCGGGIDIFGTCRKCGREWSEELEEDELAEGLPEGQQHPAEVKQVGTRKPRKNRFTKSSEPTDKYSLWRIDSTNDDNTEIIRKRSLMRLDSRRVYNQMGLSLRAHEAQKAALLWLSRLWEFLSEEEQKALTPAVEHLKRGFADIKLVAQAKVNEAARMEIALEKEHKAARTARVRIVSEDAKRRQKEAATKQITPGEDTEGMNNPDLATIDPKALGQLSQEELLELAKEKLANLDQEKTLKKRMEKLPEEDE
jgi:hypothetical protein